MTIDHKEVPVSDTDRISNDKKNITLPRAVVVSVITAAISASLSYAVAQAKMCGEVREDNIQLKVQMESAKSDVKDVRNQLEQVTSRLDKLLGQNTELITLIRVQNQLKQP